jgi:diacylglycerol kinase (ATP)
MPILLLSSAHMRAAAILGLGRSSKDLTAFQQHGKDVEWRIGMPGAGDQADIVLLFGGDGTIHRHLATLVRLELPVLVVPAGSGNDFASSLGLKRLRDSLAAWKQFCGDRANVGTIDLGLITPLGGGDGSSSQAARYFSCVAGVGLDGEVARRANQLPRWLRGHGGYALSMLPTMFTFAPFPMTILTAALQGDGNEVWSRKSDKATLIAAFANTPFYGGGMKVAPQAKMDDGLLDVCVVAGVNPFKLFCMFPTVYAGRHLGIEEVNYFQTPRARVETEHPLDVYADGEYVCRTPIEVSIAEAALKVVTLG